MQGVAVQRERGGNMNDRHRCNAASANRRAARGPHRTRIERWIAAMLVTATAVAFAMASAFAEPSTSFYVVAHEDDWQLFMGRNAALDVIAPGSKTVFIHTTAGDAGLGTGTGGTPEPYYLARENAALRAIRFLANIGVTGAGPNAVATTITINGKALHRVAYRQTVAYFLRLPDGNVNSGNGYAATGNQSLRLLAIGAIPSISAIDGSASYRGWADLAATLRGILVYEATGSTDVWINAPDPDPIINPGDHPDHVYTGVAMLDAIAPLTCVNAALFTGYANAGKPIDLDARGVMLQTALWGVTASGLADNYQLSTWDDNHNAFLGRQYFRIRWGTGVCGF
jgi:hypothetical protein